jgi:toxin FitB
MPAAGLHVVDSSGWIEFFLGGANGAHFRGVIVQTKQLIVPSVSLYEVHKKLSATVKPAHLNDCLDVMQLARVIDLTPQRALAASVTAQSHKLAMADAIMYSIALEFKATFWTQDVDYAGLPSVNYLAKHSA